MFGTNIQQGAFQIRPEYGHWSVRDPVAPTYEHQKQVRLVLGAPQSWRHVADADWKPVLPGISDQPKALPGQLSATSTLRAAVLYMDRGLDFWNGRRWRHLFGPRLKGAADNNLSEVRTLYPGIIPGDNQSLSKVDCTDLKYDQFVKLNDRHLIDSFICGTNLNSTRVSPAPWSWHYIRQPEVRCLEHTTIKNDTDALQQIELLNRIRFDSCSTEKMRAWFDLIHAAWAPSTAAIDYSDNCLQLARFYLHLHGRDPLLALMFELEHFASYSTVLQKHKLIGSGFYANRWLDVVAMPLSTLRATERCEGNRLIDELKNIEKGQTAPLLINEYGCIADGNHRYIAAMIWNILNASADCQWSLAEDQFQLAVARYVSQQQSTPNVVAFSQALEWLAVFLTDPETSHLLSAELRPSIESASVNELPAVPIMEYSTVAVVGKEYDRARTLSRFAPQIYEHLVGNSDIVLTSRACYHFADCIPLPWFSIIGHTERGRQTGAADFTSASLDLVGARHASILFT